MPAFINDEKEKELIYKCYKHNFLNENNIYCIKLTDKLKKVNVRFIKEKYFVVGVKN